MMWWWWWRVVCNNPRPTTPRGLAPRRAACATRQPRPARLRERSSLAAALLRLPNTMAGAATRASLLMSHLEEV